MMLTLLIAAITVNPIWNALTETPLVISIPMDTLEADSVAIQQEKAAKALRAHMKRIRKALERRSK